METSYPTALFARWFIVGTIFSASMSFAAEPAGNPYSFGKCDSQGNWTNAAVRALDEIRNVAGRMKADPNCNNLSAALQQTYALLATETSTLSSTSITGNRLSNTRAEIESAVGYARNDHYNLGKVQEILLQKAVQSTIAAADQVKSTGNEDPNSRQSPTVFQSTSRQVNASVHRGLDLLNSLADNAMNETLCLQNPNIAGPLMSSVIQMASAFSGSGQDSFGSKISHLTNTLSRLMTNKRYFDVFNKLGRAQFRNSISCLLETVSESYCSTLDADILYQEHVHQNGFQRDPKSGNLKDASVLGAKMNSPLRGFFVLTQLVPIITSWVERVQRGVEPRNSADSNFKNDILRNTITYYIQENNLLSTANFDQQTIRKLPDVDSKRRQVLKTVMTLNNQIVGGRDELLGLNFYTMTSLPIEIPFKLIGITIPEKVRGTQESGFQQDPGQYLAANMEQIPEFNDPDKLMATVLTNLRRLIESAQLNAIAYYNEWFIYDQAAQFVDSVTGFTYNVRDVLQQIDSYFGYVAEKIQANPQMDSSVMPMIEDTRRRIGRVLSKYEELRLLGNTFRATPSTDKIARDALIDRGVELHRKLLETAYEEFWILRARSGFLLGRVGNIVKYDMQNLLRMNPEETNKIAKDIFYATGEAAFENMKVMSGSNPYMIYADIKLAQVTHLENIEALETLLADNFTMSMSWIRMVSRNERPSDHDLKNDSLKRLLEDYYTYYPDDIKPGPIPYTEDWYDIRWMGNIFLNPLRPLRMVNFYLKHANRYAIWGQNPVWDLVGRAPYDSYASSVPQDGKFLFPEEGAAERMMAHYCIQSLAFKDTQPFQQMCEKIVLNSPFLYHQMTDQEKATFEQATPLQKFKIRRELMGSASKEFLKKELSVSYKDRLNQFITPDVREALKSNDDDLNQGARLIMARNQSSRICALREFARNNFVEYLTQGLDRRSE